MSLFEFTFGLSAVILGLALTHLASSFHALALAGRRVRWAPEPILLSGIIFLVIISVWLFQWEDREQTSTTVGLMLLQVSKLLLPYLAAAFVLPSSVGETERVDLLAHYDATRPFTYGSLIAGLLLFWTHNLVRWPPSESNLLDDVVEALARGPWIYVSIYVTLIFVRARWLNVALLAGTFLFYLWYIAGLPLTQ